MFGAITGANGVFAKGLMVRLRFTRTMNAKGGINGRKLELVIEDDACDGDKTIAVVNKLVDQDKVFLHAWRLVQFGGDESPARDREARQSSLYEPCLGVRRDFVARHSQHLPACADIEDDR